MSQIDNFRAKSEAILAEIKKANSILLHCHPSPDPDSVGSALATKFALEQMGKKVMMIKGDSEIPDGFMHFPGADQIVKKNFFEIDLKNFDLFVIVDTAATEQISRYKQIVFPLPIRSVVIDHHRTNREFADINLVENSPATAQVLFRLFRSWNVKIGPEIASNLYMGIYTDTGGFKYTGVNQETFNIAGELWDMASDLPNIISRMENSNKPGSIYFEGLALSSIQTFFDELMAISVVSSEDLKKRNIQVTDVRSGEISSKMRTVGSWKIVVALCEADPGRVRVSFRTNNADLYDVSLLAVSMGGGGHKAAAAAVLKMSTEEAKRLVVSKAKELYNL